MPRRWTSRGLAATIALAMGICGLSGTADASESVLGGGFTPASPVIHLWMVAVSVPPTDLTVNYDDNSGLTGLSAYAMGGLFQFAVTENPYTANEGAVAQELADDHPFVYVPVVATGLSFPYNIVVDGQQWTGLQLTPQDVCQIFTGELTNWNQLAGTPGDGVLADVNQPITAVVRDDPAGESYALSQYCIELDPTDWATFQAFVAANSGAENDALVAMEEQNVYSQLDLGLAPGDPIEYWPPLLEDTDWPTIHHYQDGVYTTLHATGPMAEVDDVSGSSGAFSIGYSVMGEAEQAGDAGLPTASVENAAGDFVQPAASSVQHALTDVMPGADGAVTVDDSGTDPSGYYPDVVSSVIAPTTTDAPADLGADTTLAEFLCYAIGQGQAAPADLGFAPLSSQLTQLAVQDIESIPGAPAVSDCGQAAPSPALAESPSTGLLVGAAVLAGGVAVAARRRRMRVARSRASTVRG